MVRPDVSRRPRVRESRRRRARWLASLREEQARRGWLVVTGFWPRLEAAHVLWRRRRGARAAQARARLGEPGLIARTVTAARLAAGLAARLARTIALRERPQLGALRRVLHEFASEFARALLAKLREELDEWLRESWLYKTYRYVESRVRFAVELARLMIAIRRGSAVPLFEATVETVDGVRVWRVAAVDRVLAELSPEERQRVIESIVALVERGRPLYRDWLNPAMRVLLALLVPQLYRDHCHHKGLAVRASPVVLEEVDKRGVKHVYVFIRFVRVEDARADPLIGKGARTIDPVLEEILVLKPDEDETSLLNARRRATPYTSPHRRLIEYPEVLLAVHEAGVRRALALATGVPEMDGAEGLKPCSLYLAPWHWRTHDDTPPVNQVLWSKPARRLLARPEPLMRRIVPRQELLEELGLA